MPNPLAESAASDPEDRELVCQAQGGNREAFEQLITRHQAWIYNIVLRMVYLPQDAEDATQETLVKLITKLSTFVGKSKKQLSHLALPHRRQSRVEYEAGPGRCGRVDLHAIRRQPGCHTRYGSAGSQVRAGDVQLLVDEARIGCTSGMLLCLDREQRLIYILGEIFGVTDLVGAALLEISRENFRQKLARARRDLHNFLHGKCGLVNEANPCRCAKKTRGFMTAGFVDPRTCCLPGTM